MLKKFYSSICIVLITAFLFVSFPFCVSAEEDVFEFGVCGHFNKTEYKSNIEEAMHYTAKLGGKIIRTDLTISNSSDIEYWDKFFALAKAYDFELMGVVYDAQAAEFFSSRYGEQIKYMQMLNEKDAYTIITGDGKVKSEYDINKIAETVGALKEMAPVIRENSPNTKLVVNFTWVHYGFIEHMIEQEVDFDVIGFDWYSHMDGYGFETALDEITEKFGKPIFICEANIWQNNGNQDDKMGAKIIEYIETYKRKQKSNNILGYTVYELFNEPSVSVGEDQFGMIKLNDDFSIDAPKDAYYQVQEYLGYKNKNVEKILASSLDLKQYGEYNSFFDKDESNSNESTGNVSSENTSTNNSQTDTGKKPETAVSEVTKVIYEEPETIVSEVKNVIYEEPETIQTISTKHIYKTKGFPIWLIIEIVGCVVVTAGVIAFFAFGKKLKFNRNK